MNIEGSWNFLAIDGAEVRLKSGNSGLMNLDVKAPVRSGTLHVVSSLATINLVLALDKIKTGNFLTEAAAKAFFKGYNANDLVYNAEGPHDGSVYRVSGSATAGTLDLSITLSISGVNSAPHPEVELVGSAEFGEVHIPMPGVGKVDNLQVDIDAKLAIASQS
jgi:hypothetical protein